MKSTNSGSRPAADFDLNSAEASRSAAIQLAYCLYVFYLRKVNSLSSFFFLGSCDRAS